MTPAERTRLGARLRAERDERGWTQRQLAQHIATAMAGQLTTDLDTLIDYVKRWERGRVATGPRYQLALAEVFHTTVDALIGQAPPEPEDESRPPAESERSNSLPSDMDEEDVKRRELLELAAWLEDTNIGDGAVGYLDTAVRRLAHDYARQPPLTVLREARALQDRITQVLRGGRQRIAQTRTLLGISAELFALINLLAGDVGRYHLADAYGYAAWTCAQEGDSDAARALVLCAQSKTARWEGRYAEAADMARRGFELSPVTARGRLLLGVSEATALQSRGDIPGAIEAMQRAQRARDTHSSADESADAWSCTRARQATYALQVDLGARNPGAMLRSVTAADDAWADGDQWVYGTWAQIRIGAALAYVMTGDPEGAATELGEVFDLGAEFRVVTIIGRMGEIGRRLGHSRYKGDSHAAELRERIRAFQAESLEHKALTAPETT